MDAAAFFGDRRPGRVAGCEIQVGSVLVVRCQPVGDRGREAELVERRRQPLLELTPQRRSVECSRFATIGLQGPSLDELAFDAVERRKLGMGRLKVLDLVAHAKQRGDEILEVRPDLDEELRFHLGGNRIGCAPAATSRSRSDGSVPAR